MSSDFPANNYDWLSLPKVTYRIDRRRYERARSQSFHVITPPEEFRNVFILGSTGNEYIISIRTNLVTCNCPDSHPACKHILFLLHITRLIQPHDCHVTIHPSKFLPLLWKTPKLPLVKASLLDSHTNLLCFQYHYPPCLWCRNSPDHSCGTIILCSKCGYLGHKHCFVRSYTPGSNCPKCNRPFFVLESSCSKRYRNYLNVLHHFDYVTSNISGSYESGSNGGLRCSRNPLPRGVVPLRLLSSATFIPPSPARGEFNIRDI